MRLSILITAGASVASSGFARPGTAAASKNASALAVSPNSAIYSIDKRNETTKKFSSTVDKMLVDPDYPGMAVERMHAVWARVAQLLAEGDDPNGHWEDVRRKILWAGGLRDLPDAIPGQVRPGCSRVYCSNQGSYPTDAYFWTYTWNPLFPLCEGIHGS